ncbi:hypothetical protein [Pseudomonas sp. EA_35y_Pfl2_R111]|uniref:hypothetical protein n=1 Tax=Pseudomonas sp. EA_35y_Pfl2_R111 TaxID=3088689 RepID=UPI0030DCCBCB
MSTRGRVLSQAEEFELEMRRLEWNRQQHRVPRQRPALRQRIDELLAAGWSITGRDPVRIERGVRVLQVRGGALIDG